MFAVRTDVEVRASLLARLEAARSQTDALFDIVRPDSLYERPIAERHRIVFYLAIWRRSIGTCCGNAC